MCGRFTLRTPLRLVAEAFDVSWLEELPPHYNIAPTQQVPVVRFNSQRGCRELAMLHWGLIPPWAEDPSVASRMINARAETLADKPAFREAYRARRCLVVADGFFEWERRQRKKQPHYVVRADGEPMGFAGLWERWGRGDATIESCTIVTTDANETVRHLHDRMPAIVDRDDYATWLNPELHDPEQLAGILHPAAADALVTYPVSPVVNSARIDTPECIERQVPAEPQRRLF